MTSKKYEVILPFESQEALSFFLQIHAYSFMIITFYMIKTLQCRESKSQNDVFDKIQADALIM